MQNESGTHFTYFDMHGNPTLPTLVLLCVNTVMDQAGIMKPIGYQTRGSQVRARYETTIAEEAAECRETHSEGGQFRRHSDSIDRRLRNCQAGSCEEIRRFPVGEHPSLAIQPA
jgi:hypothetical protein